MSEVCPNRSFRSLRGPKPGSALLITLLVMALMTIIVVAFLGTMNWEVQSSRRGYEYQRARAMTIYGTSSAIAQIRAALGQWDAPYGDSDMGYNGFVGASPAAPPTNFWSVSPGIISIWSYTSSTPVTNYPLFSYTTNSPALANLNAADENGAYPILGNSTPLNVDWVNVLNNPTNTASATNQIVGRYAFWVDDENSKININTADGTQKGVLAGSLGAGTPSEVSLQELSSGGSPLSTSAASNIVTIARTVGFNSPREILRAAGTTPDLYTNNVFNLTTFSRSPDFNIFGQPKMPLIPTMEGSYYSMYPSSTAPGLWNLATLQPLRELFPSQAGGNSPNVAGVLPALSMVDKYSAMNAATGQTTTTTHANVKWPLPFGQQDPMGSTFSISSPGDDDNPWNNGLVIANYLSGTNADGVQIKWPPFPGTTYTGTGPSSYLGKYTPRQIDSITLQILTLVGKDFSPDAGRSDSYHTQSGDFAIRGWLSGELVNGVGRNPKLDKVLMAFTTQAGTPPASNPPTAGIPPKVNAQLYLELWFPSSFEGVSFFHNSIVYGGWQIGNGFQKGLINSQDMGALIWPAAPPATSGGTNNFLAVPAALPKDVANGGTFPPDGSQQSASYWGNNLLQAQIVKRVGTTVVNLSNAGVDWNGNNPNYPDQDQGLAALYHPWNTNASGQYVGTGPNGGALLAPIFQMYPGVEPGPGLHNSYAPLNDWSPGQYRCIANEASGFYSTMSTNAMTTNALDTTFQISGGIQYLQENAVNRGNQEMGAVPLDAMRGSVWNKNPQIPNEQNDASQTGEAFVYVPSTLSASPYTNVMSAVIPINASVPVPPTGSLAESPTVYVYDYVSDPLVNKFPADWSTSSTPPPTMQYQNATTANPSDESVCAIYPESSQTQAGLSDPMSFWLPAIDNSVEAGTSTIDLPQMPRTARFPSIGYLQYIRTGMMPDDETVPYVQQHGTPYRLLNFAPSTSTTQSITHPSGTFSYPDWAMLDLFYMPSSLLSFGSPYETYAGTNYSTVVIAGTPSLYSTQVAYSKTNVVNNMFLYGTYGGATSGRINPNGSVIYTTNVNVPTPGITRTVPLQALLHGLVVNQTQTGNYVTSLTANDFSAPQLTAGTAVDETNVATQISNYLTTNTYGPGGGPAPFRMPGEICNVPAIASSVASNNAYRNDLVRQIIGNMTTQSNTFSIWVEGEAITKTIGNTNYGQYESGDQITSTVRYHYIVERDLNPGTDGVYGNSASPGNDQTVETLDDPATVGTSGVNPTNPNYVYRIIYAEEIR